MTIDELTGSTIDYFKDIDHYNFYDNYDNDEQAFEDVKKSILDNPAKVKTVIDENIDNILKYENLNDEIIKHHLDISVNLSMKFNQFINQKNKDLDI